MADRGYPTTLTKLGVGVLACNSALAIYRSWGDASSVAFVVAADAALVLLFLCLRKCERALRGGDGGGGGRINMGRQYSALAKVGLAVLTCNAALDGYGARRDLASAALVLVSYVVLVVLMGLFIAGFWAVF